MSDNPMTAKIEDLRERKEAAYNAGSPRSVERQHEKGKMLARERIDYFLDPGSFQELDLLARHRAHAAGLEERPYTDGVITGWGTVEGRKVFVFSQDFTVFGGALGEVFAEKIHKLMDLALKVGAPVVGLNDGAGARIQEGVVSLASYGGIFYRNVLSSGVVPQISVILGPCAGGAVYSPAMTDFIFMVRETSHMFITGPDVVKTVTGEDVTLEQLGGAMSHASKSGVATFVSTDEKACLDDVRYLLSFLPQNNLEDPPTVESSDDPNRLCPMLRDILPPSPNQPYDMKKVIREVCDDGEYFEYFPFWAKSITCGFSRLDGQVVGIVGNQPQEFAGVLDIESSEKAARFVRTCDAFNIPLITFVDVPGFLPGVNQEHDGIIRHGAKLLYAYCESTVPRIQMITRKAYGGAYVVMNSKSIGADLAYAWPTAELAVMGPQGAVEIVYRRELQQAADPVARRAELVNDYTEKYANPYNAAERGYIDDVIDPAETRIKLIAGLKMLQTKRAELPRRKHGNMPL
ncbi:MAG: acyl-CoA carboxylase subunit beta [Ilumatobacteraceae bacterium]|nr:acyl-CoA carboxylase subunit beta [Ilumatobacteraceae bacterium]MDP4702707.1 acyl-CoA carboxylase subunit beta [Ilumatobacteraceae bacterium]MDP5108782.1 acyl-CoA carboxylase subunit beta [Ilumatobacteraceae bacterium]